MQEDSNISVDIEEPIFNDCWNKIGVKGDRTCKELDTFIHCYECPVYAAVGDSLLEREPPLDYLEDWINVLEGESHTLDIYDNDQAIIRNTETLSLIIFQLGNEKLGLPVRILQQVTHPCVIQPLPHRSNQLFLGLVNIRGETLLCASLNYLLHIDQHQDNGDEQDHQEDVSIVNTINRHRMIVAGEGEDKWVFPVDAVHGIFRFPYQDLQDTPVVISKSTEGYTKGILYWENQKVNYLDSELLFYTLNNKIL